MKPRAIILTILSVLLLSTCGFNSLDTGGLSVTIDQRMYPQTLLPSISMDIDTYDIHGAGPGTASFVELDFTGTSFTIASLVFGEWTITVNGRNADGTIIGSGTATATVHTNQLTEVAVTVTPLSGTGTLDLTVDWNADDTDIPSIDAELIPPVGQSLPLGFTITGGNHGSSLTSGIDTGYHTLIVQLLDNGALTMGAVEVVRIVKDETTYGSFLFDEINKPGGSIQVNITPEMADPLTVEMTGVPDSTEVGQQMQVSASVVESVGNVVYAWYINGASVATGQTYTVSGLEEGIYRIDVTAYTADGLRAGSTTDEFRVGPAAIELTFGGTGTDRGFSAIATSSGGYLMAGLTSSYGAGGDDSFVVMSDVSGNVIWQQTFGGTYDDDRFNSVIQAADGDYVCAGTICMGTNTFRQHVVKLDPAGTVEWEQTYGSGWTYINEIVQTSDGGFITVGQTDETDAWWDCRLRKIDSEGNSEWVKHFAHAQHDEGKDILITEDGGFLIAGVAGIWGAAPYPQAWIIRTDSQGTKLWDVLWGGSDKEVARACSKTSDGAYIVAGSTKSYGLGENDVFLLKISDSGAIIWTKIIEQANTDQAMDMAVSSDGNILIAGYTDSVGAGGYDFMLLELNPDGVLQNVATWGGADNEEATSMTMAGSSEVMLFGWTNSFGAGGSDFYLVR